MKSQTFIPFKIEIEKNALKRNIENAFYKCKHFKWNGLINSSLINKTDCR